MNSSQYLPGFPTSLLSCHTVLWVQNCRLEQGVALTGCNRTRPPCSVGRPTAHSPGRQRYKWRQTTLTDASEQNNMGTLGRPVTTLKMRGPAAMEGTCNEMPNCCLSTRNNIVPFIVLDIPYLAWEYGTGIQCWWLDGRLCCFDTISEYRRGPF